MPLLVPSSERNAGEVRPSSKAMLTSSSMVTPEAAVGLRDRQAEQAHLAHAGDDRLGNAVGFRHFLLMRHQAFADELADAVQQQVQGFRITNHAHSNRPLGRLP